ncbi:MAG: hypothetical protein ACHQ53_00800 [Polyangiales bacterium]
MHIKSSTEAAFATWMVAAAVLGMATQAYAQAEGASALGQGQANINVRSDVTLGIKGLRATTSDRLAKLTEVVSDQLPAMRTCYREIVAKHPTTVGSIEIRMTLDPGDDKVGLELKEVGGSDAGLSGCVKHVFEKAPMRKLERPSAALVTLQFENTRAKGEQEMVERRQAAEHVEVRERAGGGFETSWASTDGRVGFEVGGGSRDAVEAALRAVRTSFAGLADCRRHAEKGGLSPEGQFVVELALARAGKSSAKVESSTVASPRAAQCVEHALRALKAEGAAAGQRIDLRVIFGR